MMARLVTYHSRGGVLGDLLRIEVAGTEAAPDCAVPALIGLHALTEEGIRFEPMFPFEPGLRYRARYRPGPVCPAEAEGALELDFGLPPDRPVGAVEVFGIYPSDDHLPENLLRLHLLFCRPMQRGRALEEISILGPDGEPLPDVLYRAPVELWDRSGRVLTVLLDPGRLKHGLGPNRDLGPPLCIGRTYSLVVGAGMKDESGIRLAAPAIKRFTVIDAVRAPVATGGWRIIAPAAGSREPLVVVLQTAADWAGLFNSISVSHLRDGRVAGVIAVEDFERRLRFTPARRWSPGAYRLRVQATLEDCCGNNLIAAFERPMRDRAEPAADAAVHLLPFEVG